MADAPTAITAARFSITVDGYEIASFSELQGISTEIKTVEFIESGDQRSRPDQHPRQPVLAQLVLKRAQTTDPQMWAWHEAARFGEMGAARKSCSLVMYDAAGKPVARYHLENAWPSKIELGALRAGSAEVLTETVTIVCDHLQRVAGMSTALSSVPSAAERAADHQVPVHAAPRATSTGAARCTARA